VRGLAVALAALSGAWTLFLSVSGGRDFTLFGLTLTAHNPRRPLLLLSLAVTVLTLTTRASGPGVATLRLMRAGPRLRAARLDPRLVAAALSLCALGIGLRYGPNIAAGSDSFSYVSEAQAWLRGSLVTPVPVAEQAPWPMALETLMPIGHVSTYDRRGFTPVVPPGLPMLMAGAARIGGYCAMFFVTPICGALLVFATFALGRRLAGPFDGVCAAALVLSSPIALFLVGQPMSDLPVTTFWVIAWLLVYSRRPSSSLGAGLSAAVAILIRPNLAPLAMLLPAWIALKAWRERGAERTGRVWQIVAFFAGLTPGVIVLSLVNLSLFGSPLSSGYGNVSGLFSLSNVWPNAKNYFTWFVQVSTPLPLAGLVALLLPRTAAWPEHADVDYLRILGAFVTLLVAQYLLYGIFESWWVLRFLLPGLPFVMLAFVQMVRRVVGRSEVGSLATAGLVLLLMFQGVRFANSEHAFELRPLENRYVTLARLVRDETPADSIVLAGQHSGALRYYGGRMTLNYWWMDRAWLDRTVAWLSEHGQHVFVLLDEEEVSHFKQFFAGADRLALLQSPPVLAYTGASTARLFDLVAGPPAGRTRHLKEQPFTGEWCPPPAPQPGFVLK
jgi:hypothetical protein